MAKSLRYETGPIRPPNEAYSLLLRFTRNCSWNKCAFCHIYKERKFEARKFEEIKRDIDTVKEICDDIRQMSVEKGHGGRITESLVETIFSQAIRSMNVIKALLSGCILAQKVSLFRMQILLP